MALKTWRPLRWRAGRPEKAIRTRPGWADSARGDEGPADLTGQLPHAGARYAIPAKPCCHGSGADSGDRRTQATQKYGLRVRAHQCYRTFLANQGRFPGGVSSSAARLAPNHCQNGQTGEPLGRWTHWPSAQTEDGSGQATGAPRPNEGRPAPTQEQTKGWLTVVKFHRLSYTITNF